MHRLIVGTFRHPHLYSLEFDPQQEQNALRIVGTHEATGGHSWLHLNDSKDTLYCTGWTKPPSLAAYRLSHSESSVKLELLNQAYPKYLSGYVTANKHVLYSASGPQGDVFALNSDTGAFATAGEEDVEPLQSFSFLSEAERQAIERGENIGGIMDFGGLRHGGHSADLSPDGNRLYIADIGRNAIWTYLLDPTSTPRLLTLGSKTISKRPNDGPRHVWPYQLGGGANKVVYVVQEHSSYVDVFEHEVDEDGTVKPDLVWKQGVNILPPGADCTLYWADEVRTSPSGDVLFASTRGLEPTEKGYVIAVPLDPNTGYMIPHPTSSDGTTVEPTHRWQTPTSGGWANAISVCPVVGLRREVFLCLTDSEQGWVWMLRWKREEGFAVVGSVNLNDVGAEGERDIGASVAVWLD
ncbi:hypothetical protein QFC20_005918 [Naganishia adeliensis]|uniref:Uncharacterized protein n=1 Tax=Naganishia adeliensis TaxID=92952 RepID=A0ACC2VGQ0_9TREE|nr:hypothetical protein QFC20_005918 [Naganishia adeliensis]